jgi:hypothetical protein
MTDEEEDIIITGGIVALLYFGVVKPLMSGFGLNTEQKAAVDTVVNHPSDQNPFSPLFQPFIDFYNNANTGVPISDWVHQMKINYDGLNSADQQAYNLSSGSDIDIAKAAEVINNAWSFFHIFPDYDGVKNVFASVPSKETVAAISAYLLYNYNTNLWHLLRNGGWSWFSGMKPDDITAIVNHVMSLPDIL